MIGFIPWVNDNNPQTGSGWQKGWWDYIEDIQRLVAKFYARGRHFDANDPVVVGTYTIRTPPPEAELVLPAVRLRVGETVFIVKWQLTATGDEEWTASVQRPVAFTGDLYGLFDPSRDLRAVGVSGFGTEFTFGPFAERSDQFTCVVDDVWDVATLVRMMRSDP
ncbi:MAG: hypothetical protein FKY71_09220 [Spiribacter salinus]|uniref:Uncharacterized protein n=1 Tax=Spiribacter salinus TaxID=1335746 RepID=A0A540VRD9_9GAMM|nr:MAG: hypothetical protein FKY71_09220 [Spiribacter salinus]